MKSGAKTSEFWISVSAVVINGMIAAGLFPHSSELGQAVNGVCALLVAMGYTWARVFIKVR